MLALFVLRFAEERGFAADLGEDLNEVHFKTKKKDLNEDPSFYLKLSLLIDFLNFTFYQY